MCAACLTQSHPQQFRSRREEADKARRAVAAGSIQTLLGLVGTLLPSAPFQEEALATLAVLVHPGRDVPTDEGAWLPVQRAMRAHLRESGVQAVREALHLSSFLAVFFSCY